MRIYITTDLEGPAGVNLWSQTREGDTPAKFRAMHLLTAEVNAAVDGILDAEPNCEVIVGDGHGSGGLIYEEMHPKAKVVMHGRRDPNDKPSEIKSNLASYDGYMLVGQHAMAGTADAPLCHTFSSKTVEYYKLNGMPIGEFGCHAVRFGAFDIPTIFLSGDDKACAEAKDLIPEIITAEVKKGLGIQRALHLSPTAARTLIRKNAKEAIEKLQQNAIKPYKMAGPYELEIRVLPGVNPLPRALKNYRVIDEHTIVNFGDEISDVLPPLSAP